MLRSSVDRWAVAKLCQQNLVPFLWRALGPLCWMTLTVLETSPRSQHAREETLAQATVITVKTSASSVKVSERLWKMFKSH